MREREGHEYDYDTPDDTVVVERDGASSMGVLLGVLIVLLVLAAVWWFALGPGSTTTDSGGTNVDINPPAATNPASS